MAHGVKRISLSNRKAHEVHVHLFIYIVDRRRYKGDLDVVHVSPC